MIKNTLKKINKWLFIKNKPETRKENEQREYVVHFWKGLAREDYEKATEYKVAVNDINDFCRHVQLFLNIRDNVKDDVLGWHFWVDDFVHTYEFTKDKYGVAHLIRTDYCQNFEDIIPKDNEVYESYLKDKEYKEITLEWKKIRER